MILTPAKINLALHVGKVQADGYHPVDTLCVFLNAGDALSIQGAAPTFELEVVGPFADELSMLPVQKNLVLKAALHMANRFGATPVKFRLHKAMPSASGLGGGTANGAGAMVLLNQRLPAPLAPDALIRESIVLGADGPVCMAALVGNNIAVRARGIGEKVQSYAVPPLSLCVANPGRGVSTADVFNRFDANPAPQPFDLPPIPNSTLSALAEWVESVRNDLFSPAAELEPEIIALRNRMKKVPGCMIARMSGSGATVFGIFPDPVSAERAAKRLRGEGYWSAAGSARPAGAVK